MKEIDQTFTFNGNNFHLWAEVYVDSDYNFEAVQLQIFNEDTKTDVVSFGAKSVHYPLALGDIIEDEALLEKVESVMLNEVDEGILAW
jgi:ssRNA-specific RNase YbeY (16S rRNA maturation enzyme)